ncbi:hypothetical protein KO481_30650 [Nocardia sp. NEAU-G5]|uniref:Uncharacterized protein n=1 Tax=Nocardia albiluteola TaxID=2842303 RepID=A0ABS6B6D2_9NOCA|nr:hypothetical protein [Nocardia albiluteola]MBU3065870.1 hypothetical protein [Nocardia albiluteola]
MRLEQQPAPIRIRPTAVAMGEIADPSMYYLPANPANVPAYVWQFTELVQRQYETGRPGRASAAATRAMATTLQQELFSKLETGIFRES